MGIIDEVMTLVPQVPRPPNEPIPQGTTSAAIDAMGVRLGLSIPADLHTWLQLCNCGMIGPGGLFGVCPQDPALDIEAHYRRFPHWRAKGWIPVAGDGCGNYYVLDTSTATRTGHPVLFLDHEQSVAQVCDVPRYVVASGLWPFLRYLLQAELKAAYNVFDAEQALREDPGLADDVGVPRPWEA